MEITAQELLNDDLDNVLSMTVDEALSYALNVINDSKELAPEIYLKLLSKLNELEQDAFTLALASYEITVPPLEESQFEKDIEVSIPLEIEGPALTLDEMQEAAIIEDDENGGITPEFYVALTAMSDLKTIQFFNKWLVKTGLSLKPAPKQKTIVTKDYMRKLRKKIRENRRV